MHQEQNWSKQRAVFAGLTLSLLVFGGCASKHDDADSPGKCKPDCASASGGDGGVAPSSGGAPSTGGDGCCPSSGGSASPGGSTGGQNSSGGNATTGGATGDGGVKPPLPDENGLLGYWPLDGNLKDSTGNFPAAEFGNSQRYEVDNIPLTYVPDAKGGEAIDFTGDGRAQMPYAATGLAFADDSARTISLFVKTNDFERELVWAGSGAPDDGENGDEGHRFYIGCQEQSIFVGVGNTIYRREVDWATRDSEWHHYALRLNGDRSFNVYQDGTKLVDQRSYPGSAATYGTPGQYGIPRSFLIGLGGGGDNHPANAIVDDVAVFGEALDDAEIQAISSAGSVSAWLAQ